MNFYTPYNLPKGHSDLDAVHCTDPSLTVQADRDQSDINYIVKQFGLTGKLPYGVDVPVYDDYSDIPNDYQAALEFVAASDAAFLEMPAPVRARFEHDPALFLDFVSASTNYDEAVSMGLVPPKPVLQDATQSEKSVNSPVVKPDSAQSPT
jgi:phage internal scaffolding protein